MSVGNMLGRSVNMKISTLVCVSKSFSLLNYQLNKLIYLHNLPTVHTQLVFLTQLVDKTRGQALFFLFPTFFDILILRKIY